MKLLTIETTERFRTGVDLGANSMQESASAYKPHKECFKNIMNA
jgi:hypothetical protein